MRQGNFGTQREDAQRCLEAGMNAHLSKPLDIQKLVAAIARLHAEAVQPH